MKKSGFHKNISGMTLIELLVAIAIVAILAVIGIPEYGRYSSKGKVRKAANELLLNIKLARLMAMKEDITYMIIINADNTYSIGGDVNGDGDILDVGIDGYDGTGVVRVIDVQQEHGNNVVLGAANFTLLPPNGPDGGAVADTVLFTLDPEGSVNPTGFVYLQEGNNMYSYCVEVQNAAGKVDLHSWQGYLDDAANTVWLELL